MKCQLCTKEFEPRFPKQTYCRTVCRNIAHEAYIDHDKRYKKNLRYMSKTKYSRLLRFSEAFSRLRLLVETEASIPESIKELVNGV